MFGSAGDMLSSPDIPRTPVNPMPMTAIQPAGTGMGTGTAGMGMPGTGMRMFGNQFLPSGNPLPANLPRRTPGVANQIPTATDMFDVIGGLGKMALTASQGQPGAVPIPMQSAGSTPRHLAGMNLESLVQTSAATSSGSASMSGTGTGTGTTGAPFGFAPSLIASGLGRVDGGMAAEMERAAATFGVKSPLAGMKLDPMSSTLLQNIGSLVHYRHPEGKPDIRLDPAVPAMGGRPGLADLPVTHNVFDNDVPPEVQRAMDGASSFKLPEVSGVPFHDIVGFN